MLLTSATPKANLELQETKHSLFLFISKKRDWMKGSVTILAW